MPYARLALPVGVYTRDIDIVSIVLIKVLLGTLDSITRGMSNVQCKFVKGRDYSLVFSSRDSQTHSYVYQHTDLAGR